MTHIGAASITPLTTSERAQICGWTILSPEAEAVFTAFSGTWAHAPYQPVCWVEATAATCFPKTDQARRVLSVLFNVPWAKIKFHFQKNTQTKNKMGTIPIWFYATFPTGRSPLGQWLCSNIGYQQLLSSALPGVEACQLVWPEKAPAESRQDSWEVPRRVKME